MSKRENRIEEGELGYLHHDCINCALVLQDAAPLKVKVCPTLHPALPLGMCALHETVGRL